MEQELQVAIIKARLAYMEPDSYRLLFIHQSGGKIWQHLLANPNSIDYTEVVEIAKDKASAGCIVHILPVLDEDHLLRDIIFAGARERKCPDLKIDGQFTEVKTPKDKLHANKINNNIKFAHKQADNVIIRLNSDFDLQRLKGIAKGRFISHESLQLLEFKLNGVYYSFHRSDFI